MEHEKMLKQAKCGNEEATSKLLKKYHPLIFSMQNRYFLKGFDADDWLQEGSFVFVKSLNTFDLCGKQTFGAYFKINLKRHIISLIRKQSAKKRFGDQTSLSLDQKLSEQGEGCLNFGIAAYNDAMTMILVRESQLMAWEELSEFEQKIELALFRGADPADIASELGCPLKKVKAAIERIKKKLKNHF